MHSYVIEVADSESEFGLHSTPLVSEIFTFYHLLESALCRPGRRGHDVHLLPNNAALILFICNSIPPMDFLGVCPLGHEK